MRGRVVFNGIIVRVTVGKPVEKKTKSGIILPEGVDASEIKDMYSEHPFTAEVIQIGENVKICNVGDYIYLQNPPSTPLIEDSVYYHYIREHEVIYVIDKKDVKKKKLEEMATEQLGKTSVILN